MKRFFLPVLFILTLVPFSRVHAAYTSGPVDKQMLQAESGPEAGMVTLKWIQALPESVNFHVSYGTVVGKDMYGALNVGRANPETGNLNRYTIKSLSPGTTYYFHLTSVRADGSVNYVTQSVMAKAATGSAATTFFTGPIGKHSLSAKPGPGKGQVTLTWLNAFGDTSNYHVVYGDAPGVQKWGALNVGRQPMNSYTVGALTSGKMYYFSIVPVRGGQAAYAAVSAAARAK